jgi:hypothetical protein
MRSQLTSFYRIALYGIALISVCRASAGQFRGPGKPVHLSPQANTNRKSRPARRGLHCLELVRSRERRVLGVAANAVYLCTSGDQVRRRIRDKRGACHYVHEPLHLCLACCKWNCRLERLTSHKTRPSTWRRSLCLQRWQIQGKEGHHNPSARWRNGQRFASVCSAVEEVSAANRISIMEAAGIAVSHGGKTRGFAGSTGAPPSGGVFVWALRGHFGGYSVDYGGYGRYTGLKSHHEILDRNRSGDS